MVPHNGSFDAWIETVETTEHAEIEFFILTIRVPQDSSFDV